MTKTENVIPACDEVGGGMPSAIAANAGESDDASEGAETGG